MKWAEWNGSTKNFASWLQHNRSKLRKDVDSLPDNEGICAEIFATVPDFKRSRVLEWHKIGGPDRSWDLYAFLDHIKLRFEDKESRKKSAQRLSKLRQGKYQCFAEYLQDFEVLLGKAEGMGLPDYLKIKRLEESLSSKFKSCVVPLALPENYDAWVIKVTRIANRYEAMTDWYPRNVKADDKQSYFTGEEQANKVDVRTLAQEGRPVVVREGDKIMSGINKIQALIASLQNVKSINSHYPKRRLPVAPWRIKEEYEKLRQDGKCVRCCQTGHA
ncbi:putative eka-like protein [Golovinomyces cichoracearum]|uniref:Putative eka-like protein n=1 Tax=Golovinomyces cichoracearum TaxID=62708 RepID=A0A420IQ99_9PEZI|nr:putative eka-like protein [Golovinomyces cichoracearum]